LGGNGEAYTKEVYALNKVKDSNLKGKATFILGCRLRNYLERLENLGRELAMLLYKYKPPWT